MKNSLVVVAITLIALTACSGEKTPATDTSKAADTTKAAAAPSPSAPATPARVAVMITSPAKGATAGKDVTVTLRSEGVTISKADGKKVEGVGHYHIFLDTAPSADNVPIPPTTAKIIHIGSGDSTFTFKNLPAGQHRIIAVLGYGDHTPMPAGRDTVTFTVRP